MINESHGQLGTPELVERHEQDPQLLRKELYRMLPSVAKELIISDEWYEDKADPYRQHFAERPNDPLMHESDWHQWGIISHTVQVGIAMEKTTPALLERWFGPDVAESKLGLSNEQIDGLSKWDLLTIERCHP